MIVSPGDPVGNLGGYMDEKRTLANKHLGPVVAVCSISNADLGVGGVQDVGPVTAGIHPGVDHSLGRSLSIGNVFTGSAEGQSKGLDHLEGCAVGGTGMGEIAVIYHVL